MPSTTASSLARIDARRPKSSSVFFATLRTVPARVEKSPSTLVNASRAKVSNPVRAELPARRGPGRLADVRAQMCRVEPHFRRSDLHGLVRVQGQTPSLQGQLAAGFQRQPPLARRPRGNVIASGVGERDRVARSREEHADHVRTREQHAVSFRSRVSEHRRARAHPTATFGSHLERVAIDTDDHALFGPERRREGGRFSASLCHRIFLVSFIGSTRAHPGLKRLTRSGRNPPPGHAPDRCASGRW